MMSLVSPLTGLCFCPLTALSRGSWLSSPPMLRADIEVVSSLSAPSWTASSWFLLFPFFFFSTGAAPGSLGEEEFWWVISSSSSQQQHFLTKPEAGNSTAPWGFVEGWLRQLYRIQIFYPHFVQISLELFPDHRDKGQPLANHWDQPAGEMMATQDWSALWTRRLPVWIPKLVEKIRAGELKKKAGCLLAYNGFMETVI